jgi:hypothetical protein
VLTYLILVDRTDPAGGLHHIRGAVHWLCLYNRLHDYTQVSLCGKVVFSTDFGTHFPTDITCGYKPTRRSNEMQYRSVFGLNPLMHLFTLSASIFFLSFVFSPFSFTFSSSCSPYFNIFPPNDPGLSLSPRYFPIYVLRLHSFTRLLVCL